MKNLINIVAFVALLNVMCVYANDPLDNKVASSELESPKLVRSLILQNLEEKNDFVPIDKIIIDRFFVVKPCCDKDEVSYSDFRLTYNGQQEVLTRWSSNVDAVYDDHFLLFTGNVYTYDKRTVRVTMLINPRAIKTNGAYVIYLANMASEIFFFDYAPKSTAWAINLNKKNSGKFFPLYLTKDTIEKGRYFAKYGQFVGMIRID